MQKELKEQLDDKSNIYNAGRKRQIHFKYIEEDYHQTPSQQDLSSFLKRKKHEEDDLIDSQACLDYRAQSLSVSQQNISQIPQIMLNNSEAINVSVKDQIQSFQSNENIDLNKSQKANIIAQKDQDQMNVSLKGKQLNEKNSMIINNKKAGQTFENNSLIFQQSINQKQTSRNSTQQNTFQVFKDEKGQCNSQLKQQYQGRASVKDFLKYKKNMNKIYIGGESTEGKRLIYQSTEENQWKIFAKMRKVRQFCKYLIEQKYFSNIKNLSQLHLNAINDKSYFVEEKNHLIFDKCERFPVIQPDSIKELVWNIVMFIILIQSYIVITIEICFDIQLIEGEDLYILNYIVPLIVFSIDLIIHFNIGFYDKGNIILNREQIFQNYIKFFINLVTWLCFIVQIYQSFFKVGILVRVFQIPKLLEKIDDHFQLSQRFNTFFELFKLLMLVFGCAHFVACGFHYVAIQQQSQEETWLKRQNIEDQPKQIRYLWSIYFAIITMVTVGYGDITPISWSERIYVITVTIFSCGMFGYSMNTIGAIFQEISKRNAAFKQVKYDMGQYMRNRDIPKYLQTKVLKNLEYSNMLDGNLVQKSEIIMNKLTVTLRNQIKKEFYGRILSTYKLFNLNFSYEMRTELCLLMKEIILQPGEILFDIGQSNDKIFFLHKGSVEMIELNQNKQSPTIIGIAQQGSMLGQLGFFTSQPEILQARCSNTCFLIYCDRNSFLQVVSKYSYDQEIFWKLRDNILNYNRQFDTTCFSCYKVGHETSKCQIYDTKILKQISIGRHLKSYPQQRDKSFIRKLGRSHNGLKFRIDNMIIARKIRLYLFYQAYDCDDFEINKEDLELDQNDMDFLLFIPQIFYKEGQLQYSEGEISNFSDQQYELHKQEYAQYSQQKSEVNQSLLSKLLIQHQDNNLMNASQKKHNSLKIKPSKLNENQNQRKYKSTSLIQENDTGRNLTNINMQQSSIGFNNIKNNNNNPTNIRYIGTSLTNIEGSVLSGEILQKTETLLPTPKYNQTKINLREQDLECLGSEIKFQNKLNDKSIKQKQIQSGESQQNKKYSQEFSFVNQSQGQINLRTSIDSKHFPQSQNRNSKLTNDCQKTGYTPSRPSILFNLAQIGQIQKSVQQIQQNQEIVLEEDQFEQSSSDRQDLSQKSEEKIESANDWSFETMKQIEKVKVELQEYRQERNYQNTHCSVNESIDIISQFDILKEYQGYYPNNNFTRVLQLFKDKQIRIILKRQQQNKLTQKYGIQQRFGKYNTIVDKS